MSAVGRSEGFHKPTSLPSASVTGSEVSTGRPSENRIVQSQIRHQPLQPPVLLLQLPAFGPVLTASLYIPASNDNRSALNPKIPGLSLVGMWNAEKGQDGEDEGTEVRE